MGEGNRPPFVRQIEQEHPDKQVVVGFGDQMRFGQQGTLTRVWAEKGSRPAAVRQTEYQACYLYGLSIPSRGAGAGLVLPRSDTFGMNLFLEEASCKLDGQDHLVLVLDNAGWHKSAALVVPENISLLFQPPYSPELNGQENVWQYLRGNYLSNKEYADYDALLEAGCNAWNALTPGLFKTLAHRDWIGPRN